jgi:cold shock CspA family protein
MTKSNSSNKRELEKKREQKRQEKQKRKEERKANRGNTSFDDMIAYVDENGLITDIPPDPGKKQEVNVDSIAVSTPQRNETEKTVLSGYVEYFNLDKGYGFIKDNVGKEKYFFHISNAPANIAKGNTVTYESERGEKGMSAVKIVLTKQDTIN